MRPTAYGLAVVISLAASIACRPAAAESPRGPARGGDIPLSRDSSIFRLLVPPRTTLAALFEHHRIPTAEALALVSAISQHVDPRRVRAGQLYQLDRFLDGRVREFEYDIDGDRKIIARRDEASGAFAATVEAIPKEVRLITVEGRISRDTPSLIEAFEATGERIDLALALADVFSGEVDFNNDLQPDDTFRLVVERMTTTQTLHASTPALSEVEGPALSKVEGPSRTLVTGDIRRVSYGPILSAEFVNTGRRLRANRFTVPGEKPGYYDDEGRSVRRFLLKSPLKFDPRVTSGFSRARRHPILNYTRAHNGVDYAASSGAPVVAVASGVVTLAGWNGGGGRTVKLRHASGYESEYLHLSAIAPGVRPGARVMQGESVGRVGSTGLATGPHLHYGLRRNGAYVNPVREHLNMPPGEPVPAMHLALFRTERDRLMKLLQDPGTRVTNN